MDQENTRSRKIGLCVPSDPLSTEDHKHSNIQPSSTSPSYHSLPSSFDKHPIRPHIFRKMKLKDIKKCTKVTHEQNHNLQKPASNTADVSSSDEKGESTKTSARTVNIKTAAGWIELHPFLRSPIPLRSKTKTHNYKSPARMGSGYCELETNNILLNHESVKSSTRGKTDLLKKTKTKVRKHKVDSDKTVNVSQPLKVKVCGNIIQPQCHSNNSFDVRKKLNVKQANMLESSGRKKLKPRYKKHEKQILTLPTIPKKQLIFNNSCAEVPVKKKYTNKEEHFDRRDKRVAKTTNTSKVPHTDVSKGTSNSVRESKSNESETQYVEQLSTSMKNVVGKYVIDNPSKKGEKCIQVKPTYKKRKRHKVRLKNIAHESQSSDVNNNDLNKICSKDSNTLKKPKYFGANRPSNSAKQCGLNELVYDEQLCLPIKGKSRKNDAPLKNTSIQLESCVADLERVNRKSKKLKNKKVVHIKQHADNNDSYKICSKDSNTLKKRTTFGANRPSISAKQCESNNFVHDEQLFRPIKKITKKKDAPTNNTSIQLESCVADLERVNGKSKKLKIKKVVHAKQHADNNDSYKMSSKDSNTLKKLKAFGANGPSISAKQCGLNELVHDEQLFQPIKKRSRKNDAPLNNTSIQLESCVADFERINGKSKKLKIKKVVHTKQHADNNDSYKMSSKANTLKNRKTFIAHEPSIPVRQCESNNFVHDEQLLRPIKKRTRKNDAPLNNSSIQLESCVADLERGNGKSKKLKIKKVVHTKQHADNNDSYKMSSKDSNTLKKLKAFGANRPSISAKQCESNNFIHNEQLILPIKKRNRKDDAPLNNTFKQLENCVADFERINGKSKKFKIKKVVHAKQNLKTGQKNKNHIKKTSSTDVLSLKGRKSFIAHEPSIPVRQCESNKIVHDDQSILPLIKKRRKSNDPSNNLTKKLYTCVEGLDNIKPVVHAKQNLKPKNKRIKQHELLIKETNATKVREIYKPDAFIDSVKKCEMNENKASFGKQEVLPLKKRTRKFEDLSNNLSKKLTNHIEDLEPTSNASQNFYVEHSMKLKDKLQSDKSFEEKGSCIELLESTNERLSNKFKTMQDICVKHPQMALPIKKRTKKYEVPSNNSSKQLQNYMEELEPSSNESQIVHVKQSTKLKEKCTNKSSEQKESCIKELKSTVSSSKKFKALKDLDTKHPQSILPIKKRKRKDEPITSSSDKQHKSYFEALEESFKESSLVHSKQESFKKRARSYEARNNFLTQEQSFVKDLEAARERSRKMVDRTDQYFEPRSEKSSQLHKLSLKETNALKLQEISDTNGSLISIGQCEQNKRDSVQHLINVENERAKKCAVPSHSSPEQQERSVKELKATVAKNSKNYLADVFINAVRQVKPTSDDQSIRVNHKSSSKAVNMSSYSYPTVELAGLVDNSATTFNRKQNFDVDEEVDKARKNKSKPSNCETPGIHVKEVTCYGDGVVDTQESVQNYKTQSVIPPKRSPKSDAHRLRKIKNLDFHLTKSAFRERNGFSMLHPFN